VRSCAANIYCLCGGLLATAAAANHDQNNDEHNNADNTANNGTECIRTSLDQGVNAV
jgi:hypothetical protein